MFHLQLPGCISFRPFLKHPSRKIDTKNFKLDIPFRFLTTNWETNHQTEAISTERAFAKICVADKGNFGEHSRALALLNTPRPGVAAQPE